jgi:dipeptidase D
MISFGPNIKGAHSPDERVQISSGTKILGLFIRNLSKNTKEIIDANIGAIAIW